MINVMTDEKLYELCKKFGAEALEAKRKFAGLLPEVFRRRLFEKKGYSSIFEFAAKLSGMTKDQVSLVLNLEKKFEDKPVLKEALVSGAVSASKLARVVSIATVENQNELFDAVKVLSTRAVETFVRDARREHLQQKDGVFQNRNGLCEPLFGSKSLRAQTLGTTLKLDEDVEKKLLEIQEKGIDVNEFLRQALKAREEGIEEKKEKIAEEVAGEVERYIPAKVRKVIVEEHGTKCSYPGCARLAQVLHHTQRFALTHVHDPRYIAPLCAAHHEIAHKIDVKFVERTMG